MTERIVHYRKAKFVTFVAIVVMAFMMFYYQAYAQIEGMKKTIDTLAVLSLPYGPTTLTINNRAVMVIRGKFENGNAWGGDIYTTMIKQGDTWDMVRHNEGGWKSTITATRPHTYEDSISTVRFMIKKGTNINNNIPRLYLLRIKRKYRLRPSEEAPTTFTLSALSQENDRLGVRYFQHINTATSTIKYCNADWAAHKELGLPLRKGEKEYTCEKKAP